MTLLLVQLLYLAVLFPLFGLWARYAPAMEKQRLLRRGLMTDSVYFLLYPVVHPLLVAAAILAFVLPFAGEDAVAQRFWQHGPAAQLPLAAQVPLALLLADFIGYWLHRMMHSPWLWRFHQVHHSSEEMDWLSYARFHPVDYILYYIPNALVILLLGFSPVALAVIAPFIVFYSGFLHANLHITLGSAGKWLASPAWHRWHHTQKPEGQNKNFGPLCVVWDRLFGTYYWPKEERPEPIGVTPPIGNRLTEHLYAPFRAKPPA